MATVTARTKKPRRSVEPELMAGSVVTWLQVKHAYDQCCDEIKAVVEDMIAICDDDEATSDEKNRAIVTIVEALFPLFSTDYLEAYENYARESADERAELAKEEANFAQRVETVMKEQRITQEQLGERSGVGQSAISNMLARQCRPQRRTVTRIAEALGVSPESLWPGFIAD